jgi:hypothetical protein
MSIEKLRGCEGMLIDIYADEVHKLPIVADIYSEINKNATAKMKSINIVDEPFLKYVALMYDKQSPIQKQQIENRKLIAVEQAGFKYEHDIMRAVDITDDRTVALIHYYLRYQSDFVWSAYCTTLESFYGNQQMILKGAGDAKEQETVMKLQDKLPKLIEALESYRHKIYGDNREQITKIENFTVEDYAYALEQAEEERKMESK